MKKASDSYIQNAVADLTHSHQIEDHQTDAYNPETITVLNWNIYKGRKQNWLADFRRFSHQHDLVILQEAHLGNELKKTLHENALHWTMNTAFFYRKKATGVMIASRVKPINSYGFRNKEPIIRLPKTTLINYYPIANCSQTLLVANIHSVNFTLGTAVYHRQLHELVTIIDQHSGPVIVAGDFNSWSRSRLFLIESMKKTLSLHALDDALDSDAYPDSMGHHKTRIFGKTIDHVFYRGLELIDQQVWPVDSSDHNPIRVRFRVNKVNGTAVKG